MKFNQSFIVSIIFIIASCTQSPKKEVFDWDNIKNSLKNRILKIKAKGKLPLVDIESSFGQPPFYIKDKTDLYESLKKINEVVDVYNIAFIAFAPEKKAAPYSPGSGLPNTDYAFTWGELNHRIYNLGYDWIMPTGIGSPLDPKGAKIKYTPQNYIDFMLKEILRDHYPLMGEFFFRHYPSTIQLSTPQISDSSDYNTPIDGEFGDKFFSFSQKYGIPFQLHLEIEDQFLLAIERELHKFPKAKVIWCHFGRVRKPELNSMYNPDWVEKMINKYPNLYFDLSSASVYDDYPNGSRNFVNKYWDLHTRHLDPKWRKLFENYPWRFLVAFDLGSDRMSVDRLKNQIQAVNLLLAEFPPRVGEIIAYKAAWKLLFHEDI
jgi:hypothetical protein